MGQESSMPNKSKASAYSVSSKQGDKDPGKIV